MIDTERLTIEAHAWEKMGTKRALRIKCRDQMKRPVALTIDAHLTDGQESNMPVAIHAKDGAVAGILNGLAEIAWAGGWRPKGLDAALVKTLHTFKEVPGK